MKVCLNGARSREEHPAVPLAQAELAASAAAAVAAGAEAVHLHPRGADGGESLLAADVASVNLSEPGWAELCGVLASAGIAAEAGVWSVADADQLADAGNAVEWLRILVEIMDAPAQKAVTTADEVLRRLTDLGVTPPRLLHGEGPGCWSLIAHAGRLGLPTRIGLEDTTVGANGSAASGNAELVQAALQTWTSAAAGSLSGTVPAPG
jgi:uncharacterized protein (DUF849 family)